MKNTKNKDKEVTENDEIQTNEIFLLLQNLVEDLETTYTLKLGYYF